MPGCPIWPRALFMEEGLNALIYEGFCVIISAKHVFMRRFVANDGFLWK